MTVEVTAALDGSDARTVDALYGLAFRVGAVEDAHGGSMRRASDRSPRAAVGRRGPSCSK